MICRECRAGMSHNYCESWTSYVTECGDAHEYVTLKGYWSCYACGSTLDEDDGDYYEPQ